MFVIKNAHVRAILRFAVPFVFIPAIVIGSSFIVGGQKYIYASLAVAMLSLLLFFTGFERRKTGSRKLVIVAVMTALSVVGRFIPFFKPVAALTVISGVWLGGEAGFLVGSLSAVISNFYFGQGPWTPFQMLAWGMLGLLAGFLSLPLKNSRLAITAYGCLSGIIYSFIMDIWTVMWFSGSFSPSLYLGAMISAIPHTLLYAASNVIFLWLLARPIGNKLARVKLKYGV